LGCSVPVSMIAGEGAATAMILVPSQILGVR